MVSLQATMAVVINEVMFVVPLAAPFIIGMFLEPEPTSQAIAFHGERPHMTQVARTCRWSDASQSRGEP